MEDEREPGARPASAADGSLLRCSFCNKNQRDVKKLIAGPACYICDECVDICNDIIAEDNAAVLEDPSTVSVSLDARLVGQRRAKHRLVAALRLHGGRASRRPRSHVLVVGPPGSGKTTLVEAACELLGLPVAFLDARRLAGPPPPWEDDPFETLLQRSGRDHARAQRGVLCVENLERVDDDGDPTTGRAMQRALIELVDGVELAVGTAVHPTTLATGEMLLIACANLTEPPGSVVELGGHHALLPELAARFGLVLRLEPLTDTELAHILTRPPWGLLDQVAKLADGAGVRLSFADDAAPALVERSRSLPGGVRALHAVVHSVVVEAIARTDEPDLTIDRALVESVWQG